MGERTTKLGVNFFKQDWDHVTGIFLRFGDWNGKVYCYITVALWYWSLELGQVLKDIRPDMTYQPEEY